MTPDPLDDARVLLRDLPPADADAAAAVRSRLSAYGDLGQAAAWLAAWPGPSGPRAGRVLRPLFALYVSTYDTDPQAPARARARLERLAAGGGAVSVAAHAQGAGVEAFDLGLERPCPAPGAVEMMRARETAATIAFGMEALAKAPDLLILSDATEGSAEAATGLEAALARDEDDPLELLRRHAGREVAALAGAILAARRQRTPVVLDGPAANAAAAVLARVAPDGLAHCRSAHDLVGSRCGEATGGAALALLRLAGELAAAAPGAV